MRDNLKALGKRLAQSKVLFTSACENSLSPRCDHTHERGCERVLVAEAHLECDHRDLVLLRQLLHVLVNRAVVGEVEEFNVPVVAVGQLKWRENEGWVRVMVMLAWDSGTHARNANGGLQCVQRPRATKTAQN